MAGKPSTGMMAGDGYKAPGLTWTSYADGFLSDPNACCYAFDKWYVGCISGHVYSSPTGRAGAWSLVTTLAGGPPAWRMAFFNGRLIIVTGVDLFYSTDGASFTQVTMANNMGSTWTQIDYENGYCFITYDSHSSYVWTTDFVTWTQTPLLGGGSRQASGVKWNGSTFLMAWENNGELRTFTNPALTPNPMPTTGSFPAGTDRCYQFLRLASGRLLILGTIVGSQIAAWTYSDDNGATWTGSNGGPAPNYFGHGVYAGGKVWALRNTDPTGFSSLQVSSDNGATFSEVTDDADGVVFRDLAYGSGRYLMVSRSRIYSDL